MNTSDQITSLAEVVFAKKREERKLASQASFEEKFETLLCLQRPAYEVGMSQRGTAKAPWNLPTTFEK